MRGSPKNRLPSSAEEGMLGRGPSWGGCGLGPSTAISETLTAFEPPRQQPPAAVRPSLSKEGNHAIFIQRGGEGGMKNLERTRALKLTPAIAALLSQSRHDLPKPANPLMAKLVSCASISHVLALRRS